LTLDERGYSPSPRPRCRDFTASMFHAGNAFGFEDVYTIKDTLETGTGYWLKFSEEIERLGLFNKSSEK